VRVHESEARGVRIGQGGRMRYIIRLVATMARRKDYEKGFPNSDW
jgi:hypothetical protein